MRKITLLRAERTWLIERLEARQQLFAGLDGFNKHRSAISKIFAKMAAPQLYLTPAESAFCNGCINEQMDDLYNALTISQASDLLNLDAGQLAITQKIDMGNDLMEKFGYFTRAGKRTGKPAPFRDSFYNLERL